MGGGNSCVGQARLDIAGIVNQHTQNLSDYQERGLPWNIERPQIVIEARDGREELNHVIKRCPEAREDVWLGIGRLMTNAESAYKKTLLLHETFDAKVFLEETWPSISEKNDKEALAGLIGYVVLATILAKTKALSYIDLIRFIGPVLVDLVDIANIFGAGFIILGCAAQTYSHIYMKATNPDLQFMTVEE